MIANLKVKQKKRLDSIGNVYALQAVAKNVLNKVVTEKYQTVNKKTGVLLHRAMICESIPDYYSQRNDSGQGITISKEGKACFFGVGKCGMAWTCPVCARKICHQRKLEIDDGMKSVREKGWTAFMVTTTHSHSKDQPLGDKVERKAKALKYLRSSTRFGVFKKDLGYVGVIRALEVTHGDNGWHPHTHEMWIVNRRVREDEIDGIKKSIFGMWRDACLHVGLGEPSFEHGIDISYHHGDDCDSGMIGSYLSKFGLELTNSQGKKSSGGRNAWQILESLKLKFNKYDAELFREYSEAMYGRALVFWSHGLKELLGVGDTKENIKKLKAKIKKTENKILDCVDAGELVVLQDALAKMNDRLQELLNDKDNEIADDLFDEPIARINLSVEDWGIIRSLRLHPYVLRQAELGVILKQSNRVDKWLWLQKKKLIKHGKHGFLINRQSRFRYQSEEIIPVDNAIALAAIDARVIELRKELSRLDDLYFDICSGVSLRGLDVKVNRTERSMVAYQISYLTSEFK